MSQEIPAEYFSEAEEIFERLDRNLSGEDLLKNFESKNFHQLIDEIYRDVHTLKGTSQLFGIESISTISHALEACFGPVREGKIHFDHRFRDLALQCLGLMLEILKEPKNILAIDLELRGKMNGLVTHFMDFVSKKFEGEICLPNDKERPLSSLLKFQPMNMPLPSETVPEIKQEIKPEIKIKKEVSVTDPLPLVENHESSASLNSANNLVKEEKNSPESSSIRVSVDLLDKLMNLVGEIVLTRNQVLQYAKFSDDGKFINLTQKLNLVTSELQDNVMLTRMQPIGSIFNKFQRTVRDLARDLGKDITLVIEGAETELDKSLIEAIKDPLTHIIRNSCDHGIESKEQRKKVGKKESGQIKLRAFHEGGQVIIEISDNGKGLDPQLLKDKAISKGLINEKQAEVMTVQEAQLLIFLAGFSTAEKVSTVSGRGVGMDVVKTNIEKVSGQVSIESTKGEGTSIKLKIPLTLAIVPAMIVRVKAEFYTIPQIKLKELIRIEENSHNYKIEKLQGKDVFRLRGELIPLISFQQIIDNENSNTDDKKKEVINVVILQEGIHYFGLIVDEICDTADIVIKPLASFLKTSKIFSGATIMGDGQIALILDTSGIAEKAKINHRNKNDDKNSLAEAEAQHKRQIDTSSYLLFKLQDEGTYSIPLVLVERIEEFKKSAINTSGNEIMVMYREGILPLINLDEAIAIKKEMVEKINSDDNVKVIVVERKNTPFGIVVKEIIDIVVAPSEVSPQVKKNNAILGTVIHDSNKIVTVIDVFAIIDSILGINREVDLSVPVKKLNILLAEDTAFFFKHIIKSLTALGHKVTHAEDGEKALNILKERPHDFDLVISDIEMPNMNGYQLAKAIREFPATKSIPLIAVTTHFKIVDQQKGKESGFDFYLEKLRIEEVVETMNKISKGRL